MKSIKDLGKLIEKWRQFYYFNFSYEKHLEMLIALHIRLLLMSYNSGGMSLGDSEINYDFFWSFMTFLKFEIFPGESSSPTGLLRQCIYITHFLAVVAKKRKNFE